MRRIEKTIWSFLVAGIPTGFIAYFILIPFGLLIAEGDGIIKFFFVAGIIWVWIYFTVACYKSFEK